jgi:hypothetical protein
MPALWYLILGALLLLGPGVGLVLLIGPMRRSLTTIEVLPSGLLLSSGVTGLLALFGQAGGLAIGRWAYLALALAVGLLATGILTAWRKRREARAASQPRSFRAILWALAACAFLLMAREGGSLGPVHDSLDFVAFVREILQTGDLAPASPIYQADPGTPPDPRRGSFHTQIAALCKLSGADPADAWRWLPRLLAPLAILGMGAMLRPWLGATAAWLSTVVFFATTFFTPDHFIQNLGYASRFGWVCGWAGLLALGRALEERAARRAREARALLVLAAASPAILLSVHLLSGFQELLSLGCAALAVWIDRAADRGARLATLAMMAGAIVLLLPAVALRLAHSMEVANPLFDHAYGVLMVAPGWPVLHPDYLSERFGIAGLVGSAVGIVLLALARRNRAAGFLACSTVVPLVIVFFPPFVRIVLGAHAHSLLLRVILVIPFAASLAWGALRAGSALADRPRTSAARRLGAALLLAITLAGLAAQAVSTRRQWAVPEKTRADHRESAALVRALAFLDEAFPEVQTVLSDPISSYAIPAYSGHDAVAPLHQHSSPADASVPQRIRDVQEALNGRVGMERTFRVLRRYGVDLLLVNQSWPRYQLVYYAYVSPVAYEEQRSKFEGFPELFERVYDEEGILILRVRDPGPGAALPGDPPNPAAAPDPGGRPLLAQGPDALLRFEHPDTLTAGEDLRIRTLWRRTESAYRLPILCDVKLEHAGVAGRFRTPVAGRTLRWLDERRHGTKTRFGRGYRPLGFVYPDFLWDPGTSYRDELWLPSPSDARPGVYDVWVRLVEEPYERVTWLREAWSNQLSAEWQKLAQVRVIGP